MKHSLPHVGTLLRQSRWSRQKPVRRERRTVVLVDESRFYPLLAVARTWAPCGQTPILTEWHPRDHLSVISGITRDGRSPFRTYESAINGELAARFLKHLQQPSMNAYWSFGTVRRSIAVAP